MQMLIKIFIHNYVVKIMEYYRETKRFFGVNGLNKGVNQGSKKNILLFVYN